MADSVSTEAWLDQRRWAALEEALKAQGSNVKRHLQDYLITLYNETVPLERWVQIETAITKEELESAQAAEDQKVYAAFHIRENGHDSIFSTGNGEEFLDVAMRTNPEAKMCPGKTVEKKIVREAFADMLPEEVAWRQKEQFSDGVGYSWIDTLKHITASAVSDEQMKHASERFPINPPRNKEEYYYRSIFAEHFPSDSAARSVPSVPSVACSTAEALDWDASFKKINEPSGRAVADVHENQE